MKLNLLKHIQLYGQLAVDNHSFDRSNVAVASQFGLKLFFNKLYIQTEFNYSPKNMYTSEDSVFNYSNYNQALAHPLGSNFSELIFIGQYKLNCWRLGFQASGTKYGIHSKVVKINGPYKVTDYAFSTPFIGLGSKTSAVNMLVSVSYMLNPTSNRILECGYIYRKANVDGINSQIGYFYLAVKTSLTNGNWGL